MVKYNPHLCISCQMELKTERSEHCSKCLDELLMKDFKKVKVESPNNSWF